MMDVSAACGSALAQRTRLCSVKNTETAMQCNAVLFFLFLSLGLYFALLSTVLWANAQRVLRLRSGLDCRISALTVGELGLANPQKENVG